MVSERVDEPSPESGLRSTPRTSTSSGSPDACSASFIALSLAASCLAASFLAASFLACLAASCLASLAASCLFSLAALRAAWSLFSVAGFLSREAARRSDILTVFALFTELATWVVSGSKYAAACVPMPKNRQARTRTAKKRRLRYRARHHRLRFDRNRPFLFFKAPLMPVPGKHMLPIASRQTYGIVNISNRLVYNHAKSRQGRPP